MRRLSDPDFEEKADPKQLLPLEKARLDAIHKSYVEGNSRITGFSMRDNKAINDGIESQQLSTTSVDGKWYAAVLKELEQRRARRPQVLDDAFVDMDSVLHMLWRVPFLNGRT